MRIKTLTWNIGGGKLLHGNADATRLASYTEDGIESITSVLKAENPDIITLQETQVKDEYDQAKIIADRLGYTFVHDSTSGSHIDKDHKLGHAILTRHQIVRHDHGLFTNPQAQITWEDGSIATSFDKGYTTCVIRIGDVEVPVTTLHLIPFGRFAIELDSDKAREIFDDVQSTISNNYALWLIQGDFNINDRQLRPYLPTLFDGSTAEVPIDQPTTPQGWMFDHIIYRGCKLVDSTIKTDVLTDHYPVIAEIDI